VRDSGIRVVALRSATRNNVTSAQNSKSSDNIVELMPTDIKPSAYLDSVSAKGGTLSSADSKPASCLDGSTAKERAGGEAADKCSTLQRTSHGRDFGAEPTKSPNHISATLTSTSLPTLSAVQQSQDRSHSARKTASSVNSVTPTTPTAGPNDTQLMRTIQSAGKVKMANELHPIEV